MTLPTALFVDDEVYSPAALQRIPADDCEVMGAGNGQEAGALPEMFAPCRVCTIP